MAKQKRCAVPAVMKIALGAATVDVVCVLNGRPVYYAFKPGLIVGYQALKKYEGVSTDTLLNQLLEQHHEVKHYRRILLELIRRSCVLERRMFKTAHSYVISCTCTELDNGKQHFHVAGLLDVSAVVAEYGDQAVGRIYQHALLLIGRNQEYMDVKYDGDIFVQKIKESAGGVYEPCTCHRLRGGFLCLAVPSVRSPLEILG